MKPEVAQSSEWVPLRQNRMPDGNKLQDIFKNKQSERSKLKLPEVNTDIKPILQVE